MKLENIIKKAKRGAEILALGTFLALPVFGCKKGGGGSPPVIPPPQNQSPVITSNMKTSTNEGDNFFDRVIATDPENDNLTYLLSQKPNGMTINANDGSISWTDAQEGSFPITAEVSDGKGGTAIKSYTLNVANAFDDISGKVKDILDGNAISGAGVILGHRDNGVFVADFTNISDSQGNYSFNRIPTNTNKLVKLVHSNYNTHLAGKIQTTKDENNVDFGLIPNTFDMNFFDEVARSPVLGGQTQRWLSVPQVYINTSPALGSGVQPTQQEIDLAESIFRNELPGFNNGFTTNNITITKGTNPPVVGTPGYIVFRWDDSNGPGILGSNVEFLNGNEIVSARADAKTGLTNSQQLYVYTQEQTQVFGARNDSNLETSIFNDPETVATYQPVDLNVGKILYSRPIGNKSTVDGTDSNPDSYRIR